MRVPLEIQVTCISSTVLLSQESIFLASTISMNMAHPLIRMRTTLVTKYSNMKCYSIWLLLVTEIAWSINIINEGLHVVYVHEP